MARTSSRELIIETAESLFALQGIDHVSIRQVNEATGLSAAAVHYHFKNKSALVKAVLLSHLRQESYHNPKKMALLESKEQPSVEAFVEVLLEPMTTVFLHDGRRGEYFGMLTAQIYAHKRSDYSEYIPEEFNQMYEQDWILFKRLKPELNAWQQASLFRFLNNAIVDSAASFRETLLSIKLDQDDASYTESEKASIETLSLREQDLESYKPEYLLQLKQFIEKALA